MSTPRSQVHWSRARAIACHLVSYPVLLIPTIWTAGWEKHCHLFSYKVVKKGLTGKKCLCTHALFLRLIYGRKTAFGWSSELKRKVLFITTGALHATLLSKPQVRGAKAGGSDLVATMTQGFIPLVQGLGEAAHPLSTTVPCALL